MPPSTSCCPDNTLGVAHNEGAAVPRVVIEEFLEGEEASFMVVCDGKDVVTLATSQDHKRLLDDDQGPNTGGMGAYSPAPVVTPQVHARAMREVILPTLKGMEQDGIPYTGFLYAGLMIDAKGQVKTLEFNCRMGDPETQPILMRLKSDLVDVLWAAAEPGVAGPSGAGLGPSHRAGCGVGGCRLPAGPAQRAMPVQGLPADSDEVMVFHAGTAMRDGTVVTSGGRVLCVTALAENARAARQVAYDAIASIQFDGMQYRKDIGHRAVRI
jgi:phosphoribosylamine--glycine ligase